MNNNNYKDLLKGKKGLILGIANDKSIGWAIAKTAFEAGAEIAMTYQNESFFTRIQELGKEINSNLLFECDVSVDGALENLFSILAKKIGKLDFIVHSLAYSDKKELRGEFINISKENFLNAMHISCYSLIEIAKYAKPILNENSSILTMSYYGAEKVMPNYHVMGPVKSALETTVKYMAVDLGGDKIRVNAISAGPMRTLASSGIGDFRYILRWNELNSALKRNITAEDVGKSAIYLLSDLASGVTGEIMHVDSGYNVIGMKRADAPDFDATY